MEGKRRIDLMPVPDGEPVESKKKVETEPQSVTYRFTFKVQAPTDEKCSEFSFLKLLKDAKSKEVLDNKDPFAVVDQSEDDKLAAIAKEFEEKYGDKRIAEEYIDLGEGYDTNDSFIDNAEAYDELVPSCLTTKHGGFYINAGVLDFKEIPDKIMKKKRKKKSMFITSDSESASDFKKKLPKVKHGDIKGKKRKRSLDDIVKKTKKARGKYQKTNKDKDVGSKEAKSVSELVHGNSMSNLIPQSAVKLSEEELAGIDSVIDSVVKSSMLMQGSPVEDSQDNSDTVKAPPNPESVPKLPDNLSPRLLECINFVTKAAAECTTGKGKFFTPVINQTLIEIDKMTRQVITTSMQKSSVFNHLTAHLPCGKETLLKRIKKLRQNEMDDKLKEPLEALKEAVDQEMPKQIEKHVQENLQFAQQLQQPVRSQDGAGKESEGITSQTESDEEEGKTNLEEPDKEGVLRKKRGPNKKFEWTEKIRNLTSKVVVLKMASYELAKNKGQTAEDYLKGFLENEVRCLWPKGWMQTRTLFKETRTTHAKWTNPTSKIKKVVLEGRPMGSISSQPQTSSSQPINANTKLTKPTNQNVNKITPKSQKTSQGGEILMSEFSSLLDYAEGKLSASETAELETFISVDIDNGLTANTQQETAPQPIATKPNQSSSNVAVKPNQPPASGGVSGWEAEFSKYALSNSGAIVVKSGHPTVSNSKAAVPSSGKPPKTDSSLVTERVHEVQNKAKQNLQKSAAVSLTQRLSNESLLKQNSQKDLPKTFPTTARKPAQESLLLNSISGQASSSTGSSILNFSKESTAGWAAFQREAMSHPKPKHAVAATRTHQTDALSRSKNMLNYQLGHGLLSKASPTQPQKQAMQRTPTLQKSMSSSALDDGSSGQPDITGLSLGQIQQLMFTAKSPGAASSTKEFFNDDQAWMKQYMSNYPAGYMQQRKSPGYHEGHTTPPISQSASMSSLHQRKSPENKTGYPWSSMGVSPTSPRSAHVPNVMQPRSMMGHGSSDLYLGSDTPEHMAMQYAQYQLNQQFKDGRSPDAF